MPSTQYFDDCGLGKEGAPMSGVRLSVHGGSGKGLKEIERRERV